MPALGKRAQAGFALWRDAMRWQRAVDRALRPLGLTHTQLLVLAAVARVFREDQEGATQAAIAAEAGLDAVTTSAVVRALESRGFVDRDIVDGDRRTWSVAITAKGARTLISAAGLVERA